MVIKYIAYNNAGDKVTGILEVESPERAKEALWASNLIVLSLKKYRQRPTLAQLMPTLFGVKPLDVINFTNELASLLEAGISLLPALRVLNEMTEKRALKDAINSVMQTIEKGNSFSQACASQPAVFSPFYIRLLQVAEETGELRKILLEIATYLEKRRALAGKIRKAIAYPVIVLTVGIAAAVVLITVAMPALFGLLAEYSAKIPVATQVLLTVGNIGKAYGIYILGAIVTLALAGLLYARTPRGKKKWDGILLKIPIIGKIAIYSQMSRLCSSLATLLTAGIPTTEAIRFSITAMDNAVLQEGLSRVHEEILTGNRFQAAISRQKVFPRLFSQTVGVSEESGALKVNLRGLGVFFEQETDRAATRATDMIEPTMIIIIGGMVGFVGIAIVSAVYSIIPQIK